MFFSPYLLQLSTLIFLLFITISLLFLALALMYCNVSPASSSFLFSTCTRDETKCTQCIPLVEEGMEVLSTLMLEAKTNIGCPGKSLAEVHEVEEEVAKVVEVEEEHGENVTHCVKSCDKIVKDNVVNGGSDLSVSLNVGTYISKSKRKEKERKRNIACKLLEQHNVMEGEDRIDSLWEIYALLDTYQSDSTTKSAEKAAVIVKKKKKRTHELDYCGLMNLITALLPFKCCAKKMNLRMGRTQIVKITKALKSIDLLPLHHVMKRRAWKKGQILI